MKKTIFIATVIILGGLTGAFLYNDYPDKSHQAVIVGPLSAPGKIVKYIDHDHILISTDGDTIPEFVAKVRFGQQLGDDIKYHRDKNLLNTITVTVRTVNGVGPYIADYIYDDTKTNIGDNVTNVRYARTKDKLFIIDKITEEPDDESSFMETPMVRLSTYRIVKERE